MGATAQPEGALRHWPDGEEPHLVGPGVGDVACRDVGRDGSGLWREELAEDGVGQWGAPLRSCRVVARPSTPASGCGYVRGFVGGLRHSRAAIPVPHGAG